MRHGLHCNSQRCGAARRRGTCRSSFPPAARIDPSPPTLSTSTFLSTMRGLLPPAGGERVLSRATRDAPQTARLTKPATQLC